METVWKLKKTSISDAQELAEKLVIPVPVANVMIQRGIDTPELAEDFFDLSPDKLHDPWLLPDIVPMRAIHSPQVLSSNHSSYSGARSRTNL